jgi:hypothetical protein
MTKAHKEALATGRNESRIVRRYLEALASTKPKRGRRRTVASVERRLAAVEEAIESADRITVLKLSQERLDLVNELETMSADDGMAELEEDFVSIAGQYGSRQGISYAAWREVGVPAEVLRRAGITRSA